MAEVLEREGNKVKFKVVVPADEVGKAFTGVYSALGRQVKVPGFRPGKVPRNVLERRVGRDFVLSEVREAILERAYPPAVRELELIPVSANVTPGDLSEGSAFEFTVDAENYPAVQLADFKSISIEATPETILDEAVEKAVADIRERNASFSTVERPAGEADLVSVEILTGEEHGKSYPVYMDRAEPQVRAALLEKNPGDEVDVPVTGEVAEGAQPEVVKARVQEVKEKVLPELDEAFAKNFNLDSIDAFRAAVRQDLESRAAQQHASTRKEEFITKLAAAMTVDIPAALIERRRHAMEHDIEHDLERQGMKLSEYRAYLKTEGKADEFDDDLRKSAEDRVRRDLATEALAENLNITLSDDEWKNALDAMARANRVTSAKLKDAMGEDGIENFRQAVIRDKAVETALQQLSS